MFGASRHISKTLGRFRNDQSGAALVEFAILLPILLVTFALIVEGGRIFWSYQNAITGVRDTARYVGRIAPSDMCTASPSAAIGDFQAAVSNTLTSLSTTDIAVGLDSLSLECVGLTGEYRVSPTPVAVLTASLTISNLPFTPLFQLVGGSATAQIQTTITDRSRVFGP
ncbi:MULTISPECIES: TadE/TadG family type IV pilus assembly protein [unclassified Ruegeria]|uniref:TadE/TadG family type IV pilus assembly protein n=1 Tax=unclassified Ruegeria TaxID=2625375 RepID=UPI001489F281|nr:MULTISPECIES: TadE/TadG family type IV pilus assembly protein [unclassified Ruegeria]NOD48152.1 pilus assembly protein [Ruegeria sp. HKCCD5849]NOD53513.1 pilus assembly protein [Ruegeria sp. HKCCD5851]NOD70009.1 pilus assembly protein [Ruegeria sp. HKCCD7303]NOE34527.1 pilus assembly protein [Ruegeria sp. HKCCD7318]